MGQSHKKRASKHYGYTKISNAQLRGLREAGASGSEIIAYSLLTRFHHDECNPSHAWCHQQLAESLVEMRPDVFRRSLSGLCKKHFTNDQDGKPVPVLKKVSSGHRGKAAVYDDLLYRAAVVDESYPQEKGWQNRHPIKSGEGQNSVAISTPYSVQDSVAISYELRGNVATPEEIVDNPNPRAALLAPQARQSGARHQPNKRNDIESSSPVSDDTSTSQPNKMIESTSPSLVSGGGARVGTRATTKPKLSPRGIGRDEHVTFEEWREVDEKLQSSRSLDSLSDEEKRIYTVGCAQGWQQIMMQQRVAKLISSEPAESDSGATHL